MQFLQENVSARSPNEKRRTAEELNLKLRCRVPIDVAVQDPAGIPQRSRSTWSGTPPDKGLVTGQQNIRIDISQINLVAVEITLCINIFSDKTVDDVPAGPSRAIADSIVVECHGVPFFPGVTQVVSPGPSVHRGMARISVQLIIAGPTIERHVVAIPTDQAIIARPAVEHGPITVCNEQAVITLIAVQPAGVRKVAKQAIITDPAVEREIPIAECSAERVVTEATVKRATIVIARARERIVEVRPCEVLNAHQRVGSGSPCILRTILEVNRDACRGRAVGGGVDSSPTVQHIIAAVALEYVIAGAAIEGVVAGPSCEHIIGAIAGERVVKIRAGEALNANECVASGPSCVLCSRQIEVDRDARRRSKNGLPPDRIGTVIGRVDPSPPQSEGHYPRRR